MSRKTINALEAQVAEFNRLTNRPSRAYEPSDEPYPPANIGYAYARNLGEQDDHRCSIGVIANHGGGLVPLYDLTYLHAGALLRTLRAKMKDAEWMKQQQFVPPRPSLFPGTCECCGYERTGVLCQTCAYDAEAEDNKCDKCGAPNDNGEGYDGLCGNCADKASCSECGGELGDDSYDGLCSDCAEHVTEKMTSRALEGEKRSNT